MYSRDERTGADVDALTIWRYGTAEHAEIALRDLERLQHRRRIAIDDSAVVSWAAGARRPRAYQVGTVDGAGLSGAFWGLLFSLAFLLPPGGTGGALAGVGLSDGFLRDLRDRIVPGTSALFVLSGDAPAHLRTALAAPDAALIVHPFSAEHGAALRGAFSD
jgi:uncharacterized membrane protein